MISVLRLRGPGYRLKCLLSLKRELSDLPENDRNYIEGSSNHLGAAGALAV